MPRAWVEWNGVIVTQRFYCMMSNRQCDLETTPEKEAALPSQGLSVEDAEFLANFSDEARRKVIKKVSMGDLVWKLQDANIGPRLMYVRKMGSPNPQP